MRREILIVVLLGNIEGKRTLARRNCKWENDV
jgi:hypothetical protein